MKRITNTIIESGNFTEETRYAQPRIKVEYSTRNSRPIQRTTRTESEDYDQHKRENFYVAMKTVRRLIECNFPESYSRITLTFRKPITELTEANRYFKRFIERVRYQIKKTPQHKPFQYIQVAEIQDNREEDVIHFHLVTNFTEDNEVKLLQEQWQDNGFIYAETADSTPDNNAATTTYLLKNAYDERLKGNLYNTSRNLKKPIVKEFSNYQEAQKELESINLFCLQSAEFEKPGQGMIRTAQYYSVDALN